MTNLIPSCQQTVKQILIARHVHGSVNQINFTHQFYYVEEKIL